MASSLSRRRFCGRRVRFGAVLLILSTVGLQVVVGQDILRPEIRAWGVEGDPRVEDFTAWADVTDTKSGVRNVTLIVQSASGNVTDFPLLFNGSLYVSMVPRLGANDTYTMFVRAFDNANNSATSYRITLDTHVTPPPIDHTVCLLYTSPSPRD